MPESYDDGNCRYQLRAQPYLAAIANGVRDDGAARSFLLKETEFSLAYEGCNILWQEQWKQRDPADSMTCPFWSNYWYNPCSSCNCRIDNSVSMEIDAIFFFGNAEKKTLAVHVEMKRDAEPFSHGQPEAYRPRAACYRDQRRARKTLLRHDEFVTVSFADLAQMSCSRRSILIE